MTQVALAKKLAVPIQRINTIVTGKRGVTADTALLLAEAFDTSPEFWMNLQNRVDLWEAKRQRVRTGVVKTRTVGGSVARRRDAHDDSRNAAKTRQASLSRG